MIQLEHIPAKYTLGNGRHQTDYNWILAHMSPKYFPKRVFGALHMIYRNLYSNRWQEYLERRQTYWSSPMWVEKSIYWGIPQDVQDYLGAFDKIDSYSQDDVQHMANTLESVMDNFLEYYAALDATRRLMFYFNAINERSNTNPNERHRPMHSIIALIKKSDPNRILYRGEGLDYPDKYFAIRSLSEIPTQKGPADVTIFHLFLWDVLYQDDNPSHEDIFTTEETYNFLSAFLACGIQWTTNLCIMISTGERIKRERITHTKEYIDRGLDEKLEGRSYDTVAGAKLYLSWLERQYNKLLPFFTQVGNICKRMSVRTIMSNPIFEHYIYSSGGPLERAWHPQTGGAFLKSLQGLSFADRHPRGV